MLILSRKPGESIVIGGMGDTPEIRVQILELRGNSIRLGIEAPTDIPVHREEVYQAIKQKRAKM